jgi:hypothetical protein
VTLSRFLVSTFHSSFDIALSFSLMTLGRSGKMGPESVDGCARQVVAGLKSRCAAT